MANANDRSGPAFPGTEFYDEKPVGAHPGMTLREYFAAHAPEAPVDFDFSGEPAPERPNRLTGREFNGHYVDLDELAQRVAGGHAPAADKVYGEEVIQIVKNHLKQRAEYDVASAAWANRQLLAREVAWRYAYADCMVSAGAKPDAWQPPLSGFMDPLVKRHIHDLKEVIQQSALAMTAAVIHLEECEAGKITHPFKSSSLPRLLAAIEKAKEVL